MGIFEYSTSTSKLEITGNLQHGPLITVLSESCILQWYVVIV